MQTRITKRSVDTLASPETGELILWDDVLAGFGVRARASGAKTYVLVYRAGSGRTAPLRKLTIGRHGSPWTPDTARAEAKRLLGRVALGEDPAALRVERRNAATVADLTKRFMDEHVAPKRKGRTAAEYQRLLDKIIVPRMGKLRAVDVTRADIARLHHSLRTTPFQANRTLAVISKIFNLAEAWGIRVDGTNPCRHIERFGEAARERFLSAQELAKLGEALEQYSGSLQVPIAIKLLIFTGARVNEILQLKWEFIDAVRGEARLPDSKTGAKTLHLPPPALAVLAKTPRVEGNPFVIVGQKPGANLVNLEKPWRMIRASANLNDVRLHDLRHAFAGMGASGGASLLVIGKLLGHTQTATTQRYAHLAPDPVKATAAHIADRLEAALNNFQLDRASNSRPKGPES